nr:hypothetical protein CFP56_01168 [Quercus suber]
MIVSPQGLDPSEKLFRASKSNPKQNLWNLLWYRLVESKIDASARLTLGERDYIHNVPHFTCLLLPVHLPVSSQFTCHYPPRLTCLSSFVTESFRMTEYMYALVIEPKLRTLEIVKTAYWTRSSTGKIRATSVRRCIKLALKKDYLHECLKDVDAPKTLHLTCTALYKLSLPCPIVDSTNTSKS